MTKGMMEILQFLQDMLIPWILIAFLIVFFLGRKRKIGFWLSFLTSFFLGPLMALIITLFSKEIQ